jgi:CheY-like chemotaxis protein
MKPVSKDILVKKLIRHLPSQETSLSTVLVVDDHPNTMNLVSDALDSAGYSPVVARSGKEAQDILWRIRVHAILLDLMMPEIDGVELLRRVKENPRLREIPVIVLTAKELTGAESENLKRGTRAIIGKDAQWRQEILSQLEQAFGKQPVQS